MPRKVSVAVSTLAGVAIASLALSGCVGATVPDATASQSDPVATAQEAITASGSPTPSVDVYCEHADAGYAALVTLLDHTDAKSTQTGKDGEGNVQTMNAEGEAMLAAADDVQLHWARALSVVAGEGDDVVTAFEDYFTMLEALSIPEATLAAQSGSLDDYSVATAALLSQPGVLAAATAGATGLEQVIQYNLERCTN